MSTLWVLFPGYAMQGHDQPLQMASLLDAQSPQLQDQRRGGTAAVPDAPRPDDQGRVVNPIGNLGDEPPPRHRSAELVNAPSRVDELPRTPIRLAYRRVRLHHQSRDVHRYGTAAPDISTDVMQWLQIRSDRSCRSTQRVQHPFFT